MAGFAQHVYSGNAFSLGLGGIVADSINSLEDDEPRIPDDGETIIDKFGNNADAYLRRSTNYSEAIVHRIAVMSCILMVLSGIHGFASSVTSRLWLQQLDHVDRACGRRSAHDYSWRVYPAHMVCVVRTVCLYAGTQSAYDCIREACY